MLSLLRKHSIKLFLCVAAVTVTLTVKLSVKVTLYYFYFLFTTSSISRACLPVQPTGVTPTLTQCTAFVLLVLAFRCLAPAPAPATSTTPAPIFFLQYLPPSARRPGSCSPLTRCLQTRLTPCLTYCGAPRPPTALAALPLPRPPPSSPRLLPAPPALDCSSPRRSPRWTPPCTSMSSLAGLAPAPCQPGG